MRLPQNDRMPERPRQELDQELDTSAWHVPGGPEVKATPREKEPGAPSWWRGDEDASQMFLQSMGVVIQGG